MLSEPVLLVEIVSAGNETKTRSNVWTYTTMPSLQEILAERSMRTEVEVLRRQQDGDGPDSPLIVPPPDLLALGSVDYAVPVADLCRAAGLPG